MKSKSREDVVLDENQRVAIESLDLDMLVEASAGTGKTTVLTRRFVRILEMLPEAQRACPPVLAITFTRKAASEMKERISSLLSSRGLVAGELMILTIDSFFHWVCEEKNRQDGVIELRRLADEQEIFALLTKAFSDLISENKQFDDDLQTLALALELPYVDVLEEELIQFYQKDAERFVRPYSEIQVPVCACTAEDIEILKERYQAAISTAKGNTSLRKHKEALTSILCEAHWSVEMWEQLWIAASSNSELQEQVQAASIMIDHDHRDCYALLIRMLTVFDRKVRDLKSSMHLEDYNDVTCRAIHALDDPVFLSSLRKRFRYVMIDEFQDTSYLQFLFFQKLWGDPSAASATEPNPLFFAVGDPKQSIYRFRGAEVANMSAFRNEVRKRKGLCVSLTKNFRTYSPLIEWIRSAGDFESPQSFEDQKECAIEDRGVWRSIDKDEQAHGDAMVPDLIHRLLLSDAFPSISILTRSRKQALGVARKCSQAGVLFADVNGAPFFSCPEVLAVADILRLLDGSSNRDLLARVLTGPFFCVKPENLLYTMACFETSLFHSKEDRGMVAQGVHTPMEDATAQVALHRWESLSNRYATSRLEDFLETLYWEEGYVDRMVDVFGEFAYGHLIDFSTWFVAQFHNSLTPVSDILRHIDRDEDAVVSGYYNGLETPVSISTIHKAKGLEYNTVILTDVGKTLRKSAGPIFLRKGDRLAIRFSSRLGAYAALALQDGKEELEEHKRLLYVALTRAKRCLFLHQEAQKVGQSSFLTMLSGTDDLPDAKTWFFRESMREQTNSILNGLYVPVLDTKDLRFSIGERVEVVRPSMEGSNVEELPRRLDYSDLGARFGQAVHLFVRRMIQIPDEQTSVEFLIEKFHLPMREDIKKSLMRHMRNVQKFLEGRNPERAFAELPLNIIEEGQPVHGVIDLIEEYPDRLIIIDLKTGSEEDAQKHARQIQHYGTMMHRFFPDKSIYTLLLYTKNGREKKRLLINSGGAHVENHSC